MTPSAITRSPGLQSVLDHPLASRSRSPTFTVANRTLFSDPPPPPDRCPAAPSRRAAGPAGACCVPDDGADLRVLPGPQNVSGIRETGRSTESRRCSDSPGDPQTENLPFCGYVVPSARISSSCKLRHASSPLSRECQIFLLAHREVALIGSSVETVVTASARRTHQIARPASAPAPAIAVDGRSEAGESEIHASPFRPRPWPPRPRRCAASICAFAVSICAFAASTCALRGQIVLRRVIQILLRDRLLLRQRNVAVLVQLRSG